MINVVVILVITAAVGSAIVYIVNAKKRGQCIGCPHSKECCGKCGGNK